MNIKSLGPRDVNGLILIRSGNFSPRIPKFLKNIKDCELALLYLFSNVKKKKLSKRDLGKFSGAYKYYCKDLLAIQTRPLYKVLDSLMKKKIIVKDEKNYKLNINEDGKLHVRYKFCKELYKANPGRAKIGNIPARYIALLAKEKGKVIGYLGGVIIKSPIVYYAEAENIEVHPKYRGKGIGTKLLKDFEKRCVKEGCVHIKIEAETKAAVKFYKKCGYSKGGATPERRIIMEKNILIRRN